jgi:hypothetical protein
MLGSAETNKVKGKICESSSDVFRWIGHTLLYNEVVMKIIKGKWKSYSRSLMGQLF